ncbi:MAG: bifunctional YncE family protein/alkaline phosphatase family protein [Chthonomonadetes bacterium]|nr:bifunctional YncE family protein/alkaline phosphatase family protein [Chthonomonadetes bacterium]
MRTILFIALALVASICARSAPQDPMRVGHQNDGATVVSTAQLVRPAGESLQFGGRPVDMVLSPDGRTLYLKDNRGIVVVDVGSWKVRQELLFGRGGSSMYGIAVSPDGKSVYVTNASSQIRQAKVNADGSLQWSTSIDMPAPSVGGESYPCGIALSADGKTAYVALSRNNSLAIVDLSQGRVVAQIGVGVAPFAVKVSRDGRRAYVSNWGGRHPREGERTATTSGTPALVDARGVAVSGTVSVVDLEAQRVIAEIEVGLQPCALALDEQHGRLYVANANSDTVSVIDTKNLQVVETISVRPDPSLPFGSMPNALALSPDGGTLYVANGGNNAVAVVRIDNRRNRSRVIGFIPAGWYPGAVATDGRWVFVANVKGVGSRAPRSEQKGWNVYQFLGTVNKVPIPNSRQLARYTAQVKRDARVPQVLRAWEKAQTGKKPVPVPERVGEPSVFEHVVYIIKENRTYDQVFGDIGKGASEPSLCIFGRDVTPNHHALAEQFVLLDNYYCNGVNSADGHAWSTEGNASAYLERSFGGWTRSYPFGDDPLSYSSTGFIWDHVLMAGLSFRNYGEMDYAEPEPKDATFTDIYRDFVQGTRRIRFTQNIGIENLRRYSCREYPGWNMRIPDVLRAEVFLKELKEFERKGFFPNLVIIYLPQNHTSGTQPGMPTPRAHVADNDLALGRIVEGITKSRFWPKTCIFVMEDDPQDGFDHVDGHRSLCLVISPYTRRGAVVSEFYNQTSVLHTIARILGFPPMNQMTAMAPVMTACFTDKPDFTPYTALPNRVPLDELNPPLSSLNKKEQYWALRSLHLPLDKPDLCEEDLLNRILWHAVRGVDAPYPEEYAGAHGKGLKARGLVLVPEEEEED